MAWTNPRANLNTAIDEVQTATTALQSAVTLLQALTSGKLYLKAADNHYIEVTVGVGPLYVLTPVDRGTNLPTDGLVVVPA